MPYDFVQDPVRMHCGARAPHTGVYRVFHQRHRMPHMVVILKDQALPRCKHCGDRVEYAPFMRAELPDADPDLRLAAHGPASKGASP